MWYSGDDQRMDSNMTSITNTDHIEAERRAKERFSPTYRYDGDEWPCLDYGAKVEGYIAGFVDGTTQSVTSDSEKIKNVLQQHEITSDLICSCGHGMDYESTDYETNPELWGDAYRSHQADMITRAFLDTADSEHQA